MWKNNGIEKESLKEYLENFGRVFTQKIIRMIDDAISFEKKKETTVHDIYSRLGLIKENDFNHNIDSNMMIQEFKEFIAELGSHANEYNNTISKFFGRDDIMIRVNYFFLIFIFYIKILCNPLLINPNNRFILNHLDFCDFKLEFIFNGLTNYLILIKIF